MALTEVVSNNKQGHGGAMVGELAGPPAWGWSESFGQTPPVALLPPHDSPQEVDNLAAFQAITAISCFTSNARRAPAQEANRHAVLHDSTG